jgi:heme oxygenase
MNEATPHPANVLEQLKGRTRAEHIEIEIALDLMRDDFLLADYRRLLERYFSFYAPVEARLACMLSSVQPGLDFEARRKLPLLRADLEALGAGSPDALALCDALPPLHTPAQALGCLYVLEGATLGGQVIGQHLRRRLGLTQALGARFFHGNGARTVEMWRSFRHVLTGFAADAEATDTTDVMVESANATFRSLRRWCVRPPPA